MKYIKLFLNCISRNITNKNELKFKNYNNIIINISRSLLFVSSKEKKGKKKKQNSLFFALTLFFARERFKLLEPTYDIHAIEYRP